MNATAIRTLGQMSDAEIQSLRADVIRAIRRSGDPAELLRFWRQIDAEIDRRKA